MMTEMVKYLPAELEEDNSSLGSVQHEALTTGVTHIRYHSGLTLWRQRTLLEKALLIVVAFLFVVLLLTIAHFSLHSSPPVRPIHIVNPRPHKGDEPVNYCLTPACVTVSSAVLSVMDFQADPCEDFYQFACGGWEESNPIPDGKTAWNNFLKLWQENQIVMKRILERPLNDSLSKAEQKAKIYYETCMDYNDTVETLGVSPLNKFLEERGGWMLLGNSTTEDWDFQKKLQYMHNVDGFRSFFMWDIGEDDKNSSLYTIQIDQGSLVLSNAEFYLNRTEENEAILKAYGDYIEQIAILLGGDEEKIKEGVKEIIEMETEIAEILIPPDKRRDEEKNYHRFSIETLDSITPMINWLDYFNTAFRQVNRSVKPNEQVVVYAPGYLRNLSDLLASKMSSMEGNTTLANYLMWTAVNSLVPYLSTPIRELAAPLQKALYGREKREAKWRGCATDTDSAMGFALGSMFVREAFDEDSKEKAMNMISEIRKAFINNLPTLKWMDKETRKAAKVKANAITQLIGFPPFILNRKKLDEYYSDVEVVKDEYFENYLRFKKFVMGLQMKLLHGPVNDTRWLMTPATINAYYKPSRNQIVFPAGILQAPFYDGDFPKSLNFGAMGVVMGHELIHAFDDQGREYDPFGNLKKWWNNDTIERFEKKTRCLVEQYSNYTLNDYHIKGKATLGENIADNGGLQAAFYAYQDWIEEHGVDPPLPALNLTHQQIFFLGFAQVWCSSQTPKALHVQILNDPHPPHRIRVKGTLSNSRAFAEQFQCELGSAMNPVHKCEIW